MKTLLPLTVLALSCAGCAATRHATNSPTVAAVQTTVDSAQMSAQQAVGSATRAKTALESASRAAEKVLADATPKQREGSVELRVALKTAHAAIDSTVVELKATTEALGDSQTRLGALQQQIDAMSADLVRTQSARQAAEDRADFWRSLGWRLGFLSLALGIWTFRKPLLSLLRFA